MKSTLALLAILVLLFDPSEALKREKRRTKCSLRDSILYPKCRPRVKVADPCNMQVEALSREEQMPDESHIHVVMVDDPLVLIVPDCPGHVTTTCAPNL